MLFLIHPRHDWCLNIFLISFFVQVEKILKDLQGPALALVLERLKPSGAFQGGLSGSSADSYFFKSFFGLVMLYSNVTSFLLESFDSAKAISMGPTSKSSSRVGKSTSNGVMKPGNRAMSSVCNIVLSWIFFLKCNGNIDCVFRVLERESLQRRGQGQSYYLFKI